MKTHYARTRAEHERELDMTLAGSFPASDPPFWDVRAGGSDRTGESVFPVPRPAAIDVVVCDGRRVGGIRLASLAEAIAMTATLPLAILIAGAPVLALVWGITYVVAWLTGSG